MKQNRVRWILGFTGLGIMCTGIVLSVLIPPTHYFFALFMFAGGVCEASALTVRSRER